MKLIVLTISVLLLGCSQPATSKLPVTPPPLQTEIPQPQNLPISAKATIGSEVFDLEVAITPEQQAMGLMYRRELGDKRGMLFPFQPARAVSFWMKNTLIPLDMIFLRDGEVEYIAENVPPCQATPCPVYGPPPTIAIDQVLELRAGRVQELGLKAGDRITIKFLGKN